MSFHRAGAYAVNFGLSTANKVELGGWSAGTIKHTWEMNGDYRATRDVFASAFQTTSDRRLKENINYFDSGLAQILQLKPVTFDFIGGKNNQKGFIAQDVEAVIPELVGTTEMPAPSNNVDDGTLDEDLMSVSSADAGETNEYLTLNTAAIIPYLVAAIKEQQAMILEQQAMILALTDRISALEA
jgi:hypothetical protein